MHKLYSVAAFLVFTSLFSCAVIDDNDYIDRSLITTESEKKAAEQNVNAANNSINTVAVPGTENVNPQNNNGISAGNLNPAHGLPGHRCDIAVGAPLDSKPIPVQPATVSTQPAPVTVTRETNLQKTAPGMNPPHGEPGHRCDIAVGAPLNTKPNADGSSQPNIVTTQQTAQKTTPGMNPPHGEPGHRCDIAVGAPLDSKPATPVQTSTPPPLLTPPMADSSKN